MAFTLPPPVKMICAVVAAYVINQVIPLRVIGAPIAIPLSVIITGLGLIPIVIALWQFRREHTTVNPYRPQHSTAMVIYGIFKWSRNPMYLGMALLILAAVVYLANPLSMIALAGFVINMNQTQIRIEEAALSAKFGDEFEQYCTKVRRWI